MDAILSSTLVNYLVVALGLGFVIFIHELGHFLVAKWNGVKVEAFALGFGPPLLAWRKGIGLRFGSTLPAYAQALAAREAAAEPPGPPPGETEYSLRAIPLGGFVKMLGEGDETEGEEVRSSDPRAYSNKSVPARMGIISAGVIMNVILGLICFAFAYGRGGLPIVPARVSAVMAGHPAYEAGLRIGDEIVAVNDRTDIDFFTLREITAMSGPGQVLRLSVERPGAEAPIRLDVEPARRGDSQMKTMGILPPDDLVLARPPFIPPAGLTNPGNLDQLLQPGDRVVAVRPLGAGPRERRDQDFVDIGRQGAEAEPVADAFELNALMARYRDVPLSLVVERGASATDPASTAAGTPERVTATLPVVPFADLGFRLEMGPISAIRPDSPAAEAGFRIGDRILGVEGLETLDPMRLPDFLYARAGEPVTFRVGRSEGGKPEAEVSLTVTPRAESTWGEPHVAAEALDVAEVGLAYAVGPKIAAVGDGSPAAQAKLKPGDILSGVTLTPPAGDDAQSGPITLSLEPEGDDPAYAWPAIFQEMQRFPAHSVGVWIQGVDRSYPVAPSPDPEWHNPRRGLVFQPLYRPMPPMGVVAAMRHGLDRTVQTIRNVYAMFRSLIVGDISPKMLGGPIMIADMASQTARAGTVAFLQFLGLLSLNLAVINFLPIPPLDGGQMTFLIAEWFRGRPLPDRALSAGTIFGLMLVLMLMVFVFYQDLMRYFLG